MPGSFWAWASFAPGIKDKKGRADLLKGLYPHTEAGDTKVHVVSQPLDIKCSRICLHGDLCAGFETKSAGQQRYDALKLVWRDQRGCPAPKKHCLQRSVAKPVCHFDLLAKEVNVRLHHAYAACRNPFHWPSWCGYIFMPVATYGLICTSVNTGQG